MTQNILTAFPVDKDKDDEYDDNNQGHDDDDNYDHYRELHIVIHAVICRRIY